MKADFASLVNPHLSQAKIAEKHGASQSAFSKFLKERRREHECGCEGDGDGEVDGGEKAWTSLQDDHISKCTRPSTSAPNQYW